MSSKNYSTPREYFTVEFNGRLVLRDIISRSNLLMPLIKPVATPWLPSECKLSLQIDEFL